MSPEGPSSAPSRLRREPDGDVAGQERRAWPRVSGWWLRTAATRGPGGTPPGRGRAASARSPISTPASTTPSWRDRSRTSGRRPHRAAAPGPDRPLDTHGAGGDADGPRRRAARALRRGPLLDERDHGLELGRQRVRPARDSGTGQGPGFVGAYQSIAWFYAATSGQISIRHNLMGPCGVVVAEGAGGLEALQHSRRTIRRGVGTIVTGGLEAPVGPYALACQMDTGLLSKERDPPTPSALRSRKRLRARRGRAVLLVESTERAKERGVANIYGEIAGLLRDQRRLSPRRPAPTKSSSRAPCGSPWRTPASSRATWT